MRHTNTSLALLGGLFFAVLALLFFRPDFASPASVPLPEVTVIGHAQPSTFSLSVTGYYPTGNLTYDGTTIVNRHIPPLRWCAISPDMLAKTGWQMGDTLLVSGNAPRGQCGLYMLHDLTNERLHNSLDLLVPAGTPAARWNNVKVRRFTLSELAI